MDTGVLDSLARVRFDAMLIHERWLFGECRGQASALFMSTDGKSWIVVRPNKDETCWTMADAAELDARKPRVDGDAHFRIRDIGNEYGLSGVPIAEVSQKKFGTRVELCIEFSNARELTLHYNLTTNESSLYFTRG